MIEVLKRELGLSFVKAKKLHPAANSAKVLIQRQQFAMELVRLIEQSHRIINVDETWINESGFIRKAWARKDGQGNMQLNTVTPRLSMIAAMDTDGEVWFSLAHAITDSDVITLFWWKLTLNNQKIVRGTRRRLRAG